MKCKRLTVYSFPLLLIVLLAASGCSSQPKRSETNRYTYQTYQPETRQAPSRSFIVKPAPVQEIPQSYITILSRNEWALTPPITSRLDAMGTPFRITVHHEGMGANNLYSKEDVVARLRLTQKNHMKSTNHGGLGAGDIGYHFIIDRNGRIWEGRPIQYQGAHAGNSSLNRGNIGIEVAGNFNIQYPSDSQKESLKRLILYLMKKYSVSSRNIYTHKELKPTECPGVNLQGYVDRLRTQLLQSGF